MSIPEAYPIGYHTGIDMVFWYMNFNISFLIAIIFFIRAIHTKFINKTVSKQVDL